MSAHSVRHPPDAAAPVARRVRLPADRRTPAAARAVVRAILTEAGLNDLLDEALLLTTELATNGVMHAGTDLDIEVTADPDGLLVTVTDFAPGPVEPLAVGPGARASGAGPSQMGPEPSVEEIPPAQLDGDVSERGRGLLLVDHFSSRWGTTHTPSGKGVWFRLDRGRDLGGVTADRDLGGVTADRVGGIADNGAARAPGSAPAATALAALMQVTPDWHVEDPLADFARTLLTRATELIGAAGAAVRLDRGDGAGPQVLARCGRTPRPDDQTLTVPLAVNRPYAGELELDAPPSEYARPLAVLVAERLALHVENDRLRRADLRRQSWVTFLAEASELLAQSLDVQLTLALIPQLVVPRLGQWCAVHTVDEWGHVVLAASAHADESLLGDLHAALQLPGPESVTARLREAARTGTPLPLPPPVDGLAVPLIARGQRIGTLSVGRHRQHRHDPDEIAVVQDVARRAALAVDNARIHGERRRVAHTLQQSLLPPVLPLVAGIGFAAAYVPTGDAAEVGGDFYDVVPLPHDRWLVVVGDVSARASRRPR